MDKNKVITFVLVVAIAILLAIVCRTCNSIREWFAEQFSEAETRVLDDRTKTAEASATIGSFTPTPTTTLTPPSYAHRLLHPPLHLHLHPHLPGILLTRTFALLRTVGVTSGAATTERKA